MSVYNVSVSLTNLFSIKTVHIISCRPYHLLRSGMFKFINLKFLLKLIYKVAKFSGFLFITIDVNSDGKNVIKKQFLNVIIFMISFGFSFAANSMDVYFPVAYVTRSWLLEIGINFIFRLVNYCACILKLSTLLNSETFLNIILNLQWGEKKVSFTINLATFQ